MNRVTVVLMVALLALMGVAAFAGEGVKSKPAEDQTFEGKVVCLGCTLKKGEGARAECTEYGHKHALKVDDKKYINLLENKFSADLIKGEYHDKDVKVTGTLFESANMLDVRSFEIDGKSKSWCDHCSAMDGCSAKMKSKSKK